jgi:hypothetical protein
MYVCKLGSRFCATSDRYFCVILESWSLVYIISYFPVLFTIILSISAVLTVYICCILYILFYFFVAVINFAGAYICYPWRTTYSPAQKEVSLAHRLVRQWNPLSLANWSMCRRYFLLSPANSGMRQQYSVTADMRIAGAPECAPTIAHFGAPVIVFSLLVPSLSMPFLPAYLDKFEGLVWVRRHTSTTMDRHSNL